MTNKLFSEFENTNKEEWLAKIEKDLKGKPLSSGNWDIMEGMSISPYASQEDVDGLDRSILTTHQPDWQVGEVFIVDDVKVTNKEVLQALLNGVTAPVFHFSSMPSKADFEMLFEEIQVEFIATHFTFDQTQIDYTKFYQLWTELLKSRGLTSTFACFQFEATNESRVKEMIAIAKCNKDYSQETIHINGVTNYNGDKGAKEEINTCIQEADKIFSKFTDAGVSAKDVSQQMFFTLAIGKSYLLEVAKIRALKLQWIDLLKKWKVEASLPFVKVEFANDAYGEDKHDNLINATSLAMSAILGGANHLVVKPAAQEASAKRHARNVQLVLKHESGFHLTPDPMSGSYFLEVLTSELMK